jgi:hypothetical protein
MAKSSIMIPINNSTNPQTKRPKSPMLISPLGKIKEMDKCLAMVRKGDDYMMMSYRCIKMMKKVFFKMMKMILKMTTRS